MITSSGSTSSSTRGRSSVVPSTLMPGDRACPACAGRRRRSRPARCAGRGCGAARSATCWPPLPAPTISTSRAARSSDARRAAGRSTTARTAKRAPPTNASVSRKSSAITPRGGSCVADREQEQRRRSAPTRRDDDRLQDRLEVLLVDEAPELRVEAEQPRRSRASSRRRTTIVSDEQLLVAVRDPRVEAEDVGEVVGEREQARVDADLAEAARR